VDREKNKKKSVGLFSVLKRVGERRTIPKSRNWLGHCTLRDDTEGLAEEKEQEEEDKSNSLIVLRNIIWGLKERRIFGINREGLACLEEPASFGRIILSMIAPRKYYFFWALFLSYESYKSWSHEFH